MKRATLADVAAAAGVSRSTASRALNGDPQVGAQLRQRVDEAAQTLRYSANLTARAIKSGVAQAISVVANDIRDPYFAEITRGVMQAAADAELTVTLASSLRTEDDLAVLREVAALRPYLIVLAATSYQTEPARAPAIGILKRAAGRVVVIGPSTMPFPTVDLKEEAAAEGLAKALAEMGYRHPAIVAGPHGHSSAEARLEGFRRGLWRAGIAVADSRVIRSDLTRDGGFEAMQSIARGGLQDVDLVWGVSDQTAIGAMASLRDLGVRIGEEVAVAGFDDIEAAMDVDPGLSTVRLSLREAGTAAVRLATNLEISIPEPEIRIRASTPGR